ncbi:hypothetical protein MNBD_PLANCTO02-1619 [hydrothermal vent metagenome]|uniref:Uncharacterized protein n=1 Tax=hydrothermal vent metagenome TaxID=652676 RepID=A0A3B1E8B4_9ZZZZ
MREIIEIIGLIFFAGAWSVQLYFGVATKGFSLGAGLVEREKRPLFYWTVIAL